MEHQLRHAVNVRLNAGTSGTGNIIIRSTSLGPLKPTVTASVILNLAQALVALLEFPLYRSERTVVTVVESYPQMRERVDAVADAILAGGHLFDPRPVQLIGIEILKTLRLDM